MTLNVQILWIAKDWWLLKQAATDLFRSNPSIRVGRFGGDSDKLPIPEANWDKKFNGVVYTTLKTFYLRLKDNVCPLTATLLVWDECHWAQRSKMGREILIYCKKYNIAILGLTATPLECDTFHIAFHRSFIDLANAGWLARPIVEEPVVTGVNWSPNLSDTGEIEPSSLQLLAKNANRNRLIVNHYNSNADRFCQTLIFACNIAHANLLVEIFKQSGVSVAPIHSAVPEDHRGVFLQGFRDGAIRVLVSVGMLTHGIDLPIVKSIFLCRPTTSDILFAQMIGRGARIHEGKSDFYIVEFTDNVMNHMDLIVNSKTHFKGAEVAEPTKENGQQLSARKQHHRFDPNGLPVWIPDNSSLPASIRGLWLRRGQTFGIEFELTHLGKPEMDPDDPEWGQIATEILNVIRSVTPLVANRPIDEYAGAGCSIYKDYSVWNVEYDSSVVFEITSRILSGEEGYLEVDKVCEALDRVIPGLGLDVNFETGTHVHLGWNPLSLNELRRLTRLVRLAEPGLASLVAPSRLIGFDGSNYNFEEPNLYCRPVSWCASEADIKNWKSLEDVEEAFSLRHVTFNLMSIFEHGTVEVRMHSGTIEARKILPWVSFWQQVLWAASVERTIPATEDRFVLQPDGDIVEFARKYLPSENEPSQATFLRRLDSRRREIVDMWRQNSQLSAWAEFRSKWKTLN